MICISLKELSFSKIAKIIKLKNYLFELRLDYLNLKEEELIKLLKINKNIILTDRSKSLKELVKYLDYGAKFIDLDIKKIDINTNKFKNNLIISYHNYKCTPKNLPKILANLKKHKAKYYKIAANTKSIDDNLNLVKICYNNKNLIVQGMGKYAILFRLFSPIVYAYYKTPSATGQLNYKKLENIKILIKTYLKLYLFNK